MALIDVIKYNGTPDVFAWKFPDEELRLGTQLIVNEAQEVVLFKGGQALDVFPSGRHTLTTANIPILNNIINLPFGGDSPFAAEVWYVNRVQSLDIKWGTASPIQLQDPKYKVFVPLRSYGQFGIRIEESKKFLVKLVGTLPVFDKENMVKYFRGLYLTKVKDSIASYLIHRQISVLEINAYLDELSDHIRERMLPVLDDYGIQLINFYVNDINVPEDDPAVIQLKSALAKRAEMEIVGYNYVQERSFDTLEGAATNPGSMQAGMMGAGIGLGMGVGMGSSIGSQMAGISKNININQESKNCRKCSTVMEKGARFCSSCGYDNQEPGGNHVKEETKCSRCGAVIAKGVKFCPECGDAYNPCPNCRADVEQGAGVCPSCGHKMPKPCPGCGFMIEKESAKFCPECGLSLVQKCPGCSSDITGSPKFCPDCGTKLS